MVGAILVGYIPVKVFETIFKTYDLNSSDFQIRYKTIIVDLRTDDPLRYQFTSVFLFRRVLYAGVFVLLSFYPLAQIIGGSLAIIMMFLYILIIKPYASFLSMFLSVANELLLFPMIVISGRFVNPTISPDDSQIIGLTMMSILIFTIFLNWLCIIIKGVHGCIIKRAKAKEINQLSQIKDSQTNDDSMTKSNFVKKSKTSNKSKNINYLAYRNHNITAENEIKKLAKLSC